ncbi:MAG: hypothetical protein VB085_11260, partial [Peptococcaceae bacterium]|nr:hypothetical protein [Peptococcaceae bacterium]
TIAEPSVVIRKVKPVPTAAQSKGLFISLSSFCQINQIICLIVRQRMSLAPILFFSVLFFSA